MWEQVNKHWLKLKGSDVFYSPIWKAVVVFLRNEREISSDFLPSILSKNCPIYIFVPKKEGKFVKAKLFVHFPQCFSQDLSIDLTKNHGNCVISEGNFGVFWIIDALFGNNKFVSLPRISAVKDKGGVVSW